jgi:outer membrane protein assembly factor BamE
VLRILISLIVLVTTGCSGVNFSEWHFPYMYTVQQGNYITQTQIEQLHLGMSKEQVTFVLGNPVSQFMFDLNQWQYVYQIYANDKLKNSYIVNLNFNQQQQLIKIESNGQLFTK